MGKGPLRVAIAIVAAVLSYGFVTMFWSEFYPDSDLMTLLGVGIILFFALFAAMFYMTKGSD